MQSLRDCSAQCRSYGAYSCSWICFYKHAAPTGLGRSADFGLFLWRIVSHSRALQSFFKLLVLPAHFLEQRVKWQIAMERFEVRIFLISGITRIAIVRRVFKPLHGLHLV